MIGKDEWAAVAHHARVGIGAYTGQRVPADLDADIAAARYGMAVHSSEPMPLPYIPRGCDQQGRIQDGRRATKWPHDEPSRPAPLRDPAMQALPLTGEALDRQRRGMQNAYGRWPHDEPSDTPRRPNRQ